MGYRSTSAAAYWVNLCENLGLVKRVPRLAGAVALMASERALAGLPTKQEAPATDYPGGSPSQEEFDRRAFSASERVVQVIPCRRSPPAGAFIVNMVGQPVRDAGFIVGGRFQERREVFGAFL